MKLSVVALFLLGFACISVTSPVDFAQETGLRTTTGGNEIVESIFSCVHNTEESMGTTDPTADAIKQALAKWLFAITQGNDFLNKFPGTIAADVKAKALNARTYASEESTQLAVLSSIQGLPDSARVAAANLAGFLQSGIIDQLQNMANALPANSDFATRISSYIRNIYVVRCRIILPDVDVLWKAAAAKASTSVAPAPRPTLCSSP